MNRNPTVGVIGERFGKVNLDPCWSKIIPSRVGFVYCFLIIALRMMRGVIRTSVLMESPPTCTKYEFKGVCSSGQIFSSFSTWQPQLCICHGIHRQIQTNCGFMNMRMEYIELEVAIIVPFFDGCAEIQKRGCFAYGRRVPRPYQRQQRSVSNYESTSRGLEANTK